MSELGDSYDYADSFLDQDDLSDGESEGIDSKVSDWLIGLLCFFCVSLPESKINWYFVVVHLVTIVRQTSTSQRIGAKAERSHKGKFLQLTGCSSAFARWKGELSQSKSNLLSMLVFKVFPSHFLCWQTKFVCRRLCRLLWIHRICILKLRFLKF